MEFPYVSAANSCDIQRSFLLLRPGRGGGCVIDNILCIMQLLQLHFPWKQMSLGLISSHCAVVLRALLHLMHFYQLKNTSCSTGRDHSGQVLKLNSSKKGRNWYITGKHTGEITSVFIWRCHIKFENPHDVDLELKSALKKDYDKGWIKWFQKG